MKIKIEGVKDTEVFFGEIPELTSRDRTVKVLLKIHRFIIKTFNVDSILEDESNDGGIEIIKINDKNPFKK